MRGIFLSGLLMLATVPVWAGETGKIGANTTYTLTDDGTLTISGTGDMTNYAYKKSPVFNNQSIKKIIIANGITSIGECAFCNCYNLTSVDIPTSITSIHSTAFAYCHKMKTIYVSPDNIRYCTANGVLYTKDMTTLIVYPGGQTSVTIPNSITNIGDYAFASCGGLTSINIPNSVTSIEEGAFYGCI